MPTNRCRTCQRTFYDERVLVTCPECIRLKITLAARPPRNAVEQEARLRRLALLTPPHDTTPAETCATPPPGRCAGCVAHHKSVPVARCRRCVDALGARAERATVARDHALRLVRDIEARCHAALHPEAEEDVKE